MSLQLFRVDGGISDGKVHYLSGDSEPGAAGYTAEAPVGSYYSHTTTGDSYKKITAGTGTDKWKNISVAIANVSWREPVEVLDDSSTALPTGTPGNAITVDGESITDGQRVLFSALTADKNVYIYDQATATFSEDPDNAETSGDTLYVIRGTQGGHTYTFNGTAWVRTNSSTLDELGYIRTFIGKGSLGSITPTYTEENYITTGDSLAVAIDLLDQALKVTEDKVDAAIGAVGLQADGTLAGTAFDGTNYLTGETTILAALLALDTAIADSEGDVVQASADGVTTATDVDSVLVDDVTSIEWIVYVEEAGTPANRRKVQVSAMHNGTASADATAVDYNIASILSAGSAIAGLVIEPTLSGTGATQEMSLTVTSTPAVNVRVARLTVEA